MIHPHTTLALLLALALPGHSTHQAARSACSHHHKSSATASPAPTSDSGPATPQPGKAFSLGFARKIKLGMSIDQVQALVAQPGNPLPDAGAGSSVFWMGSQKTNFAVHLDDSDKVTGWDLIDKTGQSYGMDKTGKITGPY